MRNRPWPSSLSGSVHPTPEKFENAALFLRLGLPSTNPSRKRSFSKVKCSSNRRHLKTPAFRFKCGRKHFVNGDFRKQRYDTHVISLSEFLLKHKSKMTGDCCVFTFLRRIHLIRFQSKHAVFKFLVWTGLTLISFSTGASEDELW